MYLFKIAEQIELKLNKRILSTIFNRFSKNNKFKKDWIDQASISLKNKYSKYSMGANSILFKNESSNLLVQNFPIKSDNNIVLSEGFIKGNKSIDNLYYKEFIILKTDSSYSGYEFLRDAISRIIKEDNEFEGRFKKFIKENKVRLDRITSMIEVRPPKYLGGGADGVAYLISKDKILKLYTNSFAYEKTLDSYNNLYENNIDSTEEPMIYDIGILGKFYGINIYFTILEKFKTIKVDGDIIDNLTKRAKDMFEEYVSIYGLPEKNEKNVEEITYELYNGFTAEEVQDYNNFAKNNKTKTKFRDFVKILVLKILSEKVDLHSGNLGISNRKKVVYFDPAYGHDYILSALLLRKEFKKIIKSNSNHPEMIKIKNIINEFLKLSNEKLAIMLKNNKISLSINYDGDDLLDSDFRDFYNRIKLNVYSFNLHLEPFNNVNKFMKN